MQRFRIAGLPLAMAAKVRQHLRAVQYSHPAHVEMSAGTGPCRVCLDTFKVGEEERILFTYQPFTDPGALASPGPVFIHREVCARYDGSAFPEALRSLPLAFDAFVRGGRLTEQLRVPDGRVEDAVQLLFGKPAVAYIHVRHGEAGCFIARMDREAPVR